MSYLLGLRFPTACLRNGYLRTLDRQEIPRDFWIAVFGKDVQLERLLQALC